MHIRALASIVLVAAASACSSGSTPTPPPPPLDCSQTPRPAGCPVPAPPVDCTVTPLPAGCAAPTDCAVTPDAPGCLPEPPPPPPPPPPIDCTKTPTIAECQPMVECNEQPLLPVDAAPWFGDAHAPRALSRDTDVAFDGRGNLVGVDGAGNVFRQARDGARTVLAAKAVKTARGLAFLSTGELMIADSGIGRLIAVYPDGQVRTVIPHLDFPSGLEVDRRDRVYIAERLRQVIRRYDPATRTSTVIAERLGFPPAALALSDDETTLYAVDESSDSVYAISHGEDDRWGTPRVFLTGGGGVVVGGSCTGRPQGSGCASQGRAGSCEPSGPTGQLTCTVTEPCAGRRAGDGCRGDFFEPGVCVGPPNGLQCEPPDPCARARVGAACTSGDRLGTCEDVPGLPRSCILANPCTGRLPGDTCEEDGPRGLGGVCEIVSGTSELFCSLVGECFQSSPGDACRDGFGSSGTCVDGGGGFLFCSVPEPCAGAMQDDACTVFGDSGRCLPDGFGSLICKLVEPCEMLMVGASCTTIQGDSGRCEAGPITPVCVATPACVGVPELGACTQDGVSGLCMDDFRGGLYCQTTTQCSDRQVGDVCRDGASIGSGTCAKTAEGRSYCASTRPCADDAVGERCWTPYTPGGGLCALGPRSVYCAAVTVADPCEGAEVGDACMTPDATVGTCVQQGKGGLSCEIAACADRVAGGLCQGSRDQGLCVNDGGDFVCGESEPCAGRSAGDACTHTTGGTGVCADDGRGGNYCQFAAACAGRAVGAACTARDSGLAGTCRAKAGGGVLCEVPSPCAGRAPGQACAGRAGALGVCVASELGGAVSCQTASTRFSPRAIETDACGWVYVSDASSGDVYRYARDGATRQLVSRTSYGPISSLTWTSTTMGGWNGRSLYAGTRGGGGLLELGLDVTPRRVVAPAATAVAPADTPPTGVDCLALPYAPIALNELVRPRGYHDVGFTDDGEIVGSDGSALVAVDRQDNLRPYAPTGRVEGFDRLPDGTIIAATSEGIVSVSVDGAITPLAPGVNAYGITVGPDDKVYAGTNGALLRIDPVTRLVTTYLDPADFRARTINFDIDHSLMFIGSFGEGVYVLPIDANLDPLGPPRPFATIRGGGPYLDGLGVDACGNVYIPSYSHSALYRVAPDGELRMYWNSELQQYGHGIRFGSGIGGWRADAAYLPQPYDNSTVIEVVTGVGKRP